HELVALAATLRQRHGGAALPAVLLIGNQPLCQRYSRALDACGFAAVSLAERATERGLWCLAEMAGLLSSSTSISA
ncbi:MAG: 2-dehydro-3-deoxygalactonokinase, partial [Pseudomonas sp.]